jgi:molecular chaperone GrpE
MSTEELKDKEAKIDTENTSKEEPAEATEQPAEDKEDSAKEDKEKKKKTTSKAGKKKPGKEKELEEKLKEQQDKYLRLSADFDNYRKRTLKEKAELTKFAGAEIYTSLLPVLDDFERAIASMGNSDDISAVCQGIELIYNKFRDYFDQHGIKEIDALHKEFDTDVHDAVTKIPAPKKNLKGKVVDVIEKGYMLNDKVIRYAKVVVGE